MENEDNIGTHAVTNKTLSELDDEKEKEALRKLEAVMFVTGRFLTMQELISYSDINPILLKELLEKLSAKFENDESSALQIIRKNDLILFLLFVYYKY